MRIHRLLFAASLVLTAACSPTGSGLEYERMPGVLATDVEGEPMVEVPASAAVGQAFSLRAVTLGGSCRIADEPEVRRAGREVDVSIWERHPAGGACDRALRELSHHVGLRFDQPGPAAVRVHALRDTPLGLQPVVVERTVIIQ